MVRYFLNLEDFSTKVFFDQLWIKNQYMKKDNTDDIRSKHRLRVASINLFQKAKKLPDDDISQDSKRTSRSDDGDQSELPQFYHHPRRQRDFDPL